MHVAEWIKTTSATIQVTRHYHVSYRKVVGDSWFGSINMVLAMYKYNIFFIDNVKTGTYAYPKAVIKYRCKRRGDAVFLCKQFLVAPARQQTGV